MFFRGGEQSRGGTRRGEERRETEVGKEEKEGKEGEKGKDESGIDCMEEGRDRGRDETYRFLQREGLIWRMQILQQVELAELRSQRGDRTPRDCRVCICCPCPEQLINGVGLAGGGT